MADARPLSLQLELNAGEDVDAVELDRITRQLRADLRDLELESISAVSTRALPTGAKSGGAVEVGQLALVVLPVVLPKLIEFLQAWCLRRRPRMIRIKSAAGEIEFPPGGLPATELQAVLDRLAPKPSGSTVPSGHETETG